MANPTPFTDDEWFQLAESWGMDRKTLFSLCRQYGTDTVIEKIRFTHGIDDSFFTKSGNVGEQRANYCRGAISYGRTPQQRGGLIGRVMSMFFGNP